MEPSFLNRANAEICLIKMLAAFDDEKFKLTIMTMKYLYAPEEENNYQGRSNEFDMFMKMIALLSDDTLYKFIKSFATAYDTVTLTTPTLYVRENTYWPYMRCKNFAKELLGNKKIPRSHHDLLTYLASLKGISVNQLKKTRPSVYFKNYPRTANTLAKVLRMDYRL